MSDHPDCPLCADLIASREFYIETARKNIAGWEREIERIRRGDRHGTRHEQERASWA